jgi:hypothetical protein
MKGRYAIIAAAIVLLWLIGLWFHVGFRADANPDPATYTVVGIMALVLAVVIAINVIGMRAARAGIPPPAWLPKLGIATPVLTVLAVAIAIYMFT